MRGKSLFRGLLALALVGVGLGLLAQDQKPEKPPHGQDRLPGPALSPQDALKKMADRTNTPELSSFVRSIIQADQLGISLGRILRVQATDSRLKRQAAAEEKAMKAPIKMLFPTVLFIFPAMFLVILGPAFLNLSKIF